ncbi:MAG: acid phosphatase-domain-containing protein [Monoraphidium minutum]|nr:MAG: acid phosphatase-domain-containing protein [Monoraphidium minutum]
MLARSAGSPTHQQTILFPAARPGAAALRQGPPSAARAGRAAAARRRSGGRSPLAAAATTKMGSDALEVVPKIIAFDLDGTMWFPEMYMLNGGAPFKRDHTGAVYDRSGERLGLLHDTLAIFSQLAADPLFADTEIAYVSRTEYPEWAIPALKEFHIPIPEGAEATNYDHIVGGGRGRPLTLLDVGRHKEIYPGSKTTHFKRIAKDSGVDYSDMLFFDNENWNCREVAPMGVVCVHTPRGMTHAVWREGLAKFAAARGGGGGKSGKRR